MPISKYLSAFFLLWFVVYQSNGQSPSLSLHPTTSFQLNQLQDNHLQARLTAQIQANPNLRRLMQQKKLSVGIIDLKDSYHHRYAAINGEEMMYAASLPKIAILLAAVDAIEKGELKETEAVRKDIQLMIRKSNNAASTRMIDRLGYEKIANVLKNPRYELYNQQKGGGLWVGKRYAAQGNRNPDPLKGLSHAATAAAVCKYYYLLSQSELVSAKGSEKMKSALINPGINHKFVNTIRKIAPKAKLYRKSGSWSTFHSDSIWIKGPKRNYILVALIDDPNGEQIARNMVKIAEKVLRTDKLIASK